MTPGCGADTLRLDAWLLAQWLLALWATLVDHSSCPSSISTSNSWGQAEACCELLEACCELLEACCKLRAQSCSHAESTTPHALSEKLGTPGQRRSEVNIRPLASLIAWGGRRGYLAVTLAALLQVLAFVSVSGAGEKRYTLLVSVSTCSYNCQFL